MGMERPILEIVVFSKLGYTTIPTEIHKGFFAGGVAHFPIRTIVHEQSGGYVRLMLEVEDRFGFRQLFVLEGRSLSRHALPDGGVCEFAGSSADGFKFVFRR